MAEDLELAVKSGRTDIVKSVLSTLHQQGSDNKECKDLLENILRHPHFNGESILHLASKEDQFDIVRALLTSGVDPNVKDTEGRVAYEVCASEKTRSVYQEVLLQAASQSNVSLLKAMIQCGLSVNFVDTEESGNTPLHWAASFADKETVECLCKQGADVHVVNVAGCSPIHDAVVRGNHNIVKCLLKYGADPALQISHGKYAGKTSYELAEGKPEILEILNNPPAVIEVTVMEEKLGPKYAEKNKTKEVPAPIVANGDVPNHVTQSTNQETDSLKLPQLMSPVFKRAPGVDEVSKPPLVVTEEKLGLLWPQPQHIVQIGGSPFHIKQGFHVFVSVGAGAALRDVKKKWSLFKENFESMGLGMLVEPLTPLISPEVSHIVCHVNPRLCPGKGSYRITTMQNQLKVTCNNCDTLHYAISTLLQLFSFYLEPETGEINLPQITIDDWPATPYRGALFDISQGRVPNMETFKETIKTLSFMKINQVHLYTRFRTLEQYAWQVCFNMEELMELDEFCREYSIQLCPVLEVAPAVQYEDIGQLYPVFQDFLTCFSFNEFVSVGPRLSSFLLDVGDDNELNTTDCSTMLPVRSDQTLQICGYPLHDLDPNILTQIPPQLLFNEYGVQATHDYSEFCKPLSKHGVSFLVCPGTAAWNSLAGCPEAAITNVYNAVKCAMAEGALGVLICNWSGKGHVTHMPFSWPGLLMGAGLSWNAMCHWEYCLSNLEELMNLHVFKSPKGVVGHALVELGRAETYLLRCARAQSGDDCRDLPSDNGSLLYQFLLHPDNCDIQHLTPEILQKVTRHVRKCQTELKNLELQCQQGKSIISELQHTCDLMLLAVKVGRALVVSGRNPGGQAGYDVVNLGISNLSATVKTDLANRLLELLEVYESLWKDRYIEYGLKYSVMGLQAIMKQLVPEGDPKLHNSTDGS